METLIALSIKNCLEKKGYSVYKNIEEKEDGVVFVFLSGIDYYGIKTRHIIAMNNAVVDLINLTDNKKSWFTFTPFAFKDTEEIGEHLANLIDGFLRCKNKIKEIHERQ